MVVSLAVTAGASVEPDLARGIWPLCARAFQPARKTGAPIPERSGVPDAATPRRSCRRSPAAREPAARSRPGPRRLLVSISLLLAGIAIGGAVARAQEEEPPPGYGAELASDGRYLANNLEADVEDIVTAPLHVDALGDLLRRPSTYYTLLGAGVALGGAFALDETLREHARTMSSSAALDLETAGTAFVAGGTVLLYGYGLQTDDPRARQFALTGGASAGIASLVTLAFKYGFGRTRPYQGKGAFNFFDHGQSFVSGETTPGFSLAAAVSEYFDNDWRVAVPMYSAALAVGVGRMGHDAHWASDVVGSAIVGIGTTELLLYLHREHENDPSRFRIFPVAEERGGGLCVTYDW